MDFRAAGCIAVSQIRVVIAVHQIIIWVNCKAPEDETACQGERPLPFRTRRRGKGPFVLTAPPQEATGLLPTRVQEWLRAAVKPHRFRSYKPRLGLSRGEIGVRMPVPDHLMWVVHFFKPNNITASTQQPSSLLFNHLSFCSAFACRQLHYQRQFSDSAASSKTRL